MTRQLFTLILSGALLTPLPGAAQSAATGGERSRSSDSGAVQAEVFRSALREIAERHRNVYSDSALWKAALEGMIENLNDPYAAVWSPEEVAAFEESNTGNYAGIGVQITQLNDQVTITAVFRGTPASRVGLQVGDVIVGVDGHNARDWTTQMASDSIRGTPGTDVDIVIERASLSKSIPLTITRDEVHVPAVTETIIAEDIGYVTVDRVARNSAQEVDAALRTLGDPEGLILDLRRNPGGYLDESLLMADVFLEPGEELASLKSRAVGRESGTSDESWNGRIPARIPDVPIVVLVDEYTASAAEIVAGALQDHDRALVVGQRTFGKGVVQTVRDLPYGHQLRITTGTWHTPLGRTLHRPRDPEGRPLEEDLDTFPVVRTPEGRKLLAAGGVFPDIEVSNDTLTLAERDLLEAAAGAEVPLALRIAEFGFEEATELRDAGLEPQLREDRFQAFLEELASAGVPIETLEEARDYVAWQARVTIADRMEDEATAALIRMERDRVLREAVRLLESAGSQADLFASADARAADRTSSPGG